MEASTSKSKQIPAYASYVSFVNFLNWLKGMDHVPEQIDRSLWGTKFNGATGSALMSSGRFLGLLVEERPTPRLHELVHSEEATRKHLLEQMIRSAYGNEIVDRLPGMTPKMLDEHLKSNGATDATLRKAASFFINALKATDVRMPSAIAKRARNRRASASKRGAASRGRSDGPATPGELSEADYGPALAPQAMRNTRTLTFTNGEKVSLATDTDMLSLPAEGSGVAPKGRQDVRRICRS